MYHKMNFHRFHDTWSDELRQLVHQLRQFPPPPPTTDEHRQLVKKLMSHHAKYYRAKSAAARQDVLAFFAAAPWTTTLERSLQWIGGWRPTTAYHLVYTECSILFGTHVAELMQGLSTGDLGDLSPAQFQRLSEMQIQTVHMENHLTHDLCDWQDDASNYLVESVYGGNMDRLADILERADQLRLSTIRSLVELLSTQQAIQFLVAAAELHFGIRAWGIQQDRRRSIEQFF